MRDWLRKMSLRCPGDSLGFAANIMATAPAVMAQAYDVPARFTYPLVPSGTGMSAPGAKVVIQSPWSE